MQENLPAQRLVSLWAPSHAPCSVSSPHTGHITHLYASLASLSSSPPSRPTTQGLSSSPGSSSSPLRQLLLLSFLVSPPGSSHDWPRTCLPRSRRASPGLSSGPEGRCYLKSSPLFLLLLLFSYSSFSTVPVLLRAYAPGLSSSEFPSEISFM